MRKIILVLLTVIGLAGSAQATVNTITKSVCNLTSIMERSTGKVVAVTDVMFAFSKYPGGLAISDNTNETYRGNYITSRTNKQGTVYEGYKVGNNAYWLVFENFKEGVRGADSKYISDFTGCVSKTEEIK